VLPALEILENGEQARFCSGVDLERKRALFRTKFGSFQNAADAQHADVVGLTIEFCGHGASAIHSELAAKHGLLDLDPMAETAFRRHNLRLRGSLAPDVELWRDEII